MQPFKQELKGKTGNRETDTNTIQEHLQQETKAETLPKQQSFNKKAVDKQFLHEKTTNDRIDKTE